MSTGKSYYDRILEEMKNLGVPMAVNLDHVDLEDAIACANQGDTSALVCVVIAFAQGRLQYSQIKEVLRSNEDFMREETDLMVAVYIALATLDDNPEEDLCRETITSYANNGHAGCQSYLAIMHYEGNLVEKSMDLATYWAKKAKRNGDSTAMDLLFPNDHEGMIGKFKRKIFGRN